MKRLHGAPNTVNDEIDQVLLHLDVVRYTLALRQVRHTRETHRFAGYARRNCSLANSDSRLNRNYIHTTH